MSRGLHLRDLRDLRDPPDLRELHEMREGVIRKQRGVNIIRARDLKEAAR